MPMSGAGRTRVCQPGRGRAGPGEAGRRALYAFFFLRVDKPFSLLPSRLGGARPGQRGGHGRRGAGGGPPHPARWTRAPR